MTFNLENDFNSLSNLLATYQEIWGPEVMNSYPESLNAYPTNWVKEIKEKPEDCQWKIDAGVSYDEISTPDLKGLFSNLQSLSNFKKLESLNIPFTDADYFKMKDKKRHEIKQISGFLKNQPNLANSCIDVGGGIGHLSRTLVNKHQMKSVVIESNNDFCEIGKEVNKKLNVNNIDYRSEAFNKDSIYHHDCDTLTMGLHACGDLSCDIIEYTAKNNLKNILSFGCCYFKTTQNTYRFLSTLGAKAEFKLSKYSLTLASRAHTGLSKEAFIKKKKVKSYRYGLHLFLYEQLQIKEFKEVGESKFSLYQGSFSDYAMEKLKYLKIEGVTKNTLDEFFECSRTQDLIESMFCANIIRWQFGRAIEKLIILDRAIYLKENNYKVELGELFDENISPRNIGIFAEKLS